MVSRVSNAGGPSHSVALLLLLLLLHALLVVALLRWTGQRLPEPTAGAVTGVLLLPELISRGVEVPAPIRAAPETGDAEVLRPAVTRGLRSRSDPSPGKGADEPGRPAGPTAAAPGRAIDCNTPGEAVARDAAARAALPPKGPLDRRALRPALPAARIPRSVFADDESRVGRTTRNADGETIYWVSPNCYISLGSDSIALRDVHAMHKGMTFCRIPLGKRKARGDLFDDMPTQRGSRYAEKYDPASTEPQPVR